MPIVTGQPPSAMQLMEKIMRLSPLNPNGFRNPRRRPGGIMTLTEKTGLDAGVLSLSQTGFETSDRARRKRMERRVTRAVLREQRETGEPVSFRREKEIRAEIIG